MDLVLNFNLEESKKKCDSYVNSYQDGRVNSLKLDIYRFAKQILEVIPSLSKYKRLVNIIGTVEDNLVVRELMKEQEGWILNRNIYLKKLLQDISISHFRLLKLARDVPHLQELTKQTQHLGNDVFNLEKDFYNITNYFKNIQDNALEKLKKYECFLDYISESAKATLQDIYPNTKFEDLLSILPKA